MLFRIKTSRSLKLTFFYGMNLIHSFLGSPLSTPFSQNLIRSRPFNIHQDFKPGKPHVSLQQIKSGKHKWTV